MWKFFEKIGSKGQFSLEFQRFWEFSHFFDSKVYPNQLEKQKRWNSNENWLSKTFQNVSNQRFWKVGLEKTSEFQQLWVFQTNIYEYIYNLNFYLN